MASPSSYQKISEIQVPSSKMRLSVFDSCFSLLIQLDYIDFFVEHREKVSVICNYLFKIVVDSTFSALKVEI